MENAVAAAPESPLVTAPKGKVMNSHRLHRLAGLVAAVAIALSAGPVHTTGGAASPVGARLASVIINDVCPAGTNWDNTVHLCR
jgi:hypothetical protein